MKATQIAFSESASAAVYGTGVYAAKGQNPTSNAGDNVFPTARALSLRA
ncbi:MAG: hypothetical protein ABJA98_24185 [Acidobacteriota bacterium]